MQLFSKYTMTINMFIYRKANIMRGFTEFDLDGDGFVSFPEMKAVMGPKGFPDSEIAVMLDKYDTDGDGRLNYVEFARFWDIPIY